MLSSGSESVGRALEGTAGFVKVIEFSSKSRGWGNVIGGGGGGVSVRHCSFCFICAFRRSRWLL